MKVLFTGKFCEGQELQRKRNMEDTQPLDIVLEEDDRAAMLKTCEILHHKVTAWEMKTVSALDMMAKTSDKYDFGCSLSLYSHVWLDKRNILLSDSPRDFPAWIAIAYRLNNAEAFYRLTSKVIEFHENDLGSLFKNSKEAFPGPPISIWTMELYPFSCQPVCSDMLVQARSLIMSKAVDYLQNPMCRPCKESKCSLLLTGVYFSTLNSKQVWSMRSCDSLDMLRKGLESLEPFQEEFKLCSGVKRDDPGHKPIRADRVKLISLGRFREWRECELAGICLDCTRDGGVYKQGACRVSHKREQWYK
jgi:hypothetical protein